MKKTRAWLRLIIGFPFMVAAPACWANFDQAINDAFRPVATAMVDFVFYSVVIAGSEFPLIVLWLIGGALYLSLIHI